MGGVVNYFEAAAGHVALTKNVFATFPTALIFCPTINLGRLLATTNHLTMVDLGQGSLTNEGGAGGGI